MLSEKEAWLKLAECWGNLQPPTESEVYYTRIDDAWCSGICGSIWLLQYEEEIDQHISKSMVRKINLEKQSHIGGYGFRNLFIWPLTQEGAVIRSAFCSKMAEAIS